MIDSARSKASNLYPLICQKWGADIQPTILPLVAWRPKSLGTPSPAVQAPAPGANALSKLNVPSSCSCISVTRWLREISERGSNQREADVGKGVSCGFHRSPPAVHKVKNIADVRKTLRGSYFARAGQNTQAVKIVFRPPIDALASSLDRPTTVCSLLYGAGIPCSLMVRLCSAASHHPPQWNHAADDLLRRAACCLIAAGSPADFMLCGRFDVAIAHVFEAARLVVKVRVAAPRWWLRG